MMIYRRWVKVERREDEGETEVEQERVESPEEV